MAAERRWEAVRSRGSPAGRQQLPARCRPALGHICCPSSGLSDFVSKLPRRRFGSTDRRSRRNGSKRRRCPWLEAQTFAVRPISLVIGSADSESQCSGAAKNAGSGQRFRVGPVRWVDELGDVVTRPRVVKRAWQRELGGVLASSSGRQRRPSMQSVQQARG